MYTCYKNIHNWKYKPLTQNPSNLRPVPTRISFLVSSFSPFSLLTCIRPKFVLWTIYAFLWFHHHPYFFSSFTNKVTIYNYNPCAKHFAKFLLLRIFSPHSYNNSIRLVLFSFCLLIVEKTKAHKLGDCVFKDTSTKMWHSQDSKPAVTPIPEVLVPTQNILPNQLNKGLNNSFRIHGSQ